MEYSCEWSRAGGACLAPSADYRFLPNRISTVTFTIATVKILTTRMRIMILTSFQLR
jgi:hypothetical protein